MAQRSGGGYGEPECLVKQTGGREPGIQHAARDNHSSYKEEAALAETKIAEPHRQTAGEEGPHMKRIKGGDNWGCSIIEEFRFIVRC